MRGLRPACLLLVLAYPAGAQVAAGPDGLLERIQATAKVNLTGLPDYICLQTVTRTQRDTPEDEYTPVDTIRVEVGLIGDRELYAWPDASHFEEENLADLVQRGTIGNGNFALHARNVFLSGAPAFTPRGEEEMSGRAVIRYDFDVPIERSAYSLRAPPLQARVPFHGSFWVDADTLDLIHLHVIADEINPELGLIQAYDRMEYARVPIGKSDFLLPKKAELLMLGDDGAAALNHTSFSACRQYVGESSISFSQAPPEQSAPAAATGAGLRLPPHLELDLALDTVIDSRSAVVGDPVRAVLSRPLKDGGEILAPKGAAVLGRLVRLDRYDQPVGHYVIGLEFNSLESGGQHTQFTATMKNVTGSSALVKQAKRLDPTFKKKRKGFMQVLVNETQPGQGIIHWKAAKPVVNPGLKMVWEVEPQP